MTTSYLLPNKLRIPGAILAAAGLLLLVLKYKFNIKPDFLEMKFFAFYAYYIEAKSFSVITHQMIEEIGGVLVLCGLFMVAFSREKEEKENLGFLRLKAFIFTAYLNLVYVLIAVLFFYGFGFVGVLTFFTIIWLVGYIFAFHYLRFRLSRQNKEE